MEFQRLRLAGFKSFADPVEIALLPGLTGIVGPNGCGKSNLTEAMRWAMGEARAGGLRADAMDEVIFAGARGRPGRNLAEVTIGLTRDNEPLEITRRIARGEGSTYLLNGREARQRDVQLLFADAATGAHAAALVGQGRIAAVIAAKPVERRQMLEEAAGIAGLAVRRREAELRLRAASANLARVGGPRPRTPTRRSHPCANRRAPLNVMRTSPRASRSPKLASCSQAGAPPISAPPPPPPRCAKSKPRFWRPAKPSQPPSTGAPPPPAP